MFATIVICIFSHRAFIHFRVVVDERIKILIVEVSKRKCFTGTFKPELGVTIFATDTLKIKRI